MTCNLTTFWTAWILFKRQYRVNLIASFYPEPSPLEGTARRPPDRPALPSNTKGPALFLGVSGPSRVNTSPASGVAAPERFISVVFVVLGARPLGISMLLTYAISPEAGWAAWRRANSPLTDTGW